MILVNNYGVAVFLCVLTMLCWGSWANTQKLAQRSWRFELYYWDYAVGVLGAALLYALTLGSLGYEGRSVLMDLAQADATSLFSAFVGGVVFNAANILLVAAIAIAGMAVAFPVGIGLALVLGVVVNFLAVPVGDPLVLFSGIALIVAAILLDAAAYRKLLGAGGSVSRKGLILSILCGVLMGFFYRFVAASMSSELGRLEDGKLGPYAAVLVFAVGLSVSNLLFNTLIMKRPIQGEPLSMSQYFEGSLPTHLTGVLGGLIWGTGMVLSILASGQAGFAISYGLGQGATMVAALWGVFVWREFSESPKGTDRLLFLMFICYIGGLSLVIAARS